MFKFLFAMNEKKFKNTHDEYTPLMEGHSQLYDETEGIEFLDDVVEIEKTPSSENDENDRA